MRKGDGGKQESTRRSNKPKWCRREEKREPSFAYLFHLKEVVDTKESNDKGVQDRPDFGEGCIIHMAIVYVTPNLTKN
jgi:hypothetical protein